MIELLMTVAFLGGIILGMVIYAWLTISQSRADKQATIAHIALQSILDEAAKKKAGNK